MEHFERNLDAEFLKSIIHARISNSFSKGQLVRRLQARERLVFIMGEDMQILIGENLHSQLTQEAGIDENKTNLLKGTTQFMVGGLHFGSNYNDFFEEMGVEPVKREELWQTIKLKITRELT